MTPQVLLVNKMLPISIELLSISEEVRVLSFSIEIVRCLL